MPRFQHPEQLHRGNTKMADRNALSQGQETASYFFFFLSAHRFFINSDSRLRPAALICGRFRPAFLSAHHLLLASPIRFRAFALIRRRFPAGCAEVLPGFPGPRFGASPSRTEMA